MKVRFFKYFPSGRKLLNDTNYMEGKEKSKSEILKSPGRTQVINFLLSQLNRETTYLEIGVRNPEHNYDHIEANTKYSVDPGLVFTENPVDFKMTSDEFFNKLDKNEILNKEMRFDLIFIDGLHLAEQVNRDIAHSLRYIKEDGFIVLHDCNPPTEWHARETHGYLYTPAGKYWNGTTWKAFLKWRFDNSVQSCCIDCDWGVGIISKGQPIGDSVNPENPFYEFHVFDTNRREYLNLIEFGKLKEMLREKKQVRANSIAKDP